MEVRKLDTGRKADVRQFIEFPFDLYRNSPLWVPPLLMDLRLVMNRQKHPFYRHSTAEFFLAEAGGRAMGRIAVFDNRAYNDHYGSHTAFFYFFECVEDTQVAQALFDAAFDWARSRGLDRIIGPKGPQPADGIGLLVEGFEHRPAMGIPYNCPYYDSLLQSCGFEKRGDLLSGYLSADYSLPQRFFELAERIKQRRGFRIQSFRRRSEGKLWIPRVGRLLNAAFEGSQDFYPFREEEMASAARQILQVADPRLIKLVMKGDDVVGFLFAFPNLGTALRRTKGRLWPLGWLDLLLEYRRTEWVDINGLGLLPEHRGLGANAILYTELAKTLQQFKFKHADIVQVGEENSKSLAEMETLGVKWYKRHRLYQRNIA